MPVSGPHRLADVFWIGQSKNGLLPSARRHLMDQAIQTGGVCTIMSTQELAGRTALGTGASSGSGRAAALALAGLGAQVLIAGRDEQRGEQVVKHIGAGGGTAVFL